jgi:hypothetical protein
MSDEKPTLAQRIAETAYSIWVQEGKPDGKEQRHWEMASDLISQEDKSGTTQMPILSPAGITFEPMVSIENQGNFPELTEQVDPPPVKDAKRPRKQA